MFHFAPKTPPGGPGATSALPHNLNTLFETATPQEILRQSLDAIGDMAVVSSFGAEAVVLLHIAAQVDKDLPILFIDTNLIFPETLTYQTQVADHLGLRNVITLRAPDIARADPDNTLHKTNPDACCALRKTAPLQEALKPYAGWFTGRKRFQSGARAHLPLVEREPGSARLKVNPLAEWDASQIQDYMTRHALPRHPLVAKGYNSIGCAPCTSPTQPGEDSRAGRWRGRDKDECGIHFVDGRMQRQGAPQ